MDRLNHSQNISQMNEELNNLLILDYMIVTILIFALDIVGVIGNLLVFKIYFFNIKLDPLSGRAFIPALAFMDLLSCISGSVLQLVQNLQPAAYKGDALCKFLYVFAYSWTMAASFMLLVISVHRYLKVCKPFSKQFTIFWMKSSPLIAAAGGIVLALPMFPIVGQYHYFHEYYQRYGQKCTVLYHTHLKVYFWIYFNVVATAFFASAIAISVLSFLIHRQIRRQIQFRRKSSVSQIEASFTPQLAKEESQTESQSESNSRNSSMKSSSLMRNVHQTMSDSAKPKRRKGEKREYTIMFLIISVAFVVTWLPSLITNGIRVLFVGIEETSAPGVFVTTRLMTSIFILNNVINPIIYFRFDKEFKKQFLNIFARCITKGNEVV